MQELPHQAATLSNKTTHGSEIGVNSDERTSQQQHYIRRHAYSGYLDLFLKFSSMSSIEAVIRLAHNGRK